MPPRDKRPFIFLCFCGSLTFLATLNMIYLVVTPSDPVTIYLLSDLIGKVPLFPYAVVSLSVTIILLAASLLTLTAVIQADTEALIQQYLFEHQVIEESPDSQLETTSSLITAQVSPLSPEETASHVPNKQVQTLQTEVSQQRHDTLIKELRDITLAATARDAQSDNVHAVLGEDQASIAQLVLHSIPSAIKGIGAKTEAALQALGVTTVWEFLVADPEWIAEHTSMTIKRVQHLQDIVYAEVASIDQSELKPLTTTPSTT
jgi:predicted flap endonuclease-1-like 5' DNA nuclease